MMPTIHYELTGRGLLILLGLVLAALLILSAVWFWISPAYAIGGGIGLVLLVRGAIALVTPSQKID